MSLSSTEMSIDTAVSHMKVHEAYILLQNEFLQYSLLMSEETALVAIAPYKDHKCFGMFKKEAQLRLCKKILKSLQAKPFLFT